MAAENSFDIVCKIDMQEVTNALDQARREIETRYDLKGTKNEVTLDKTDIVLVFVKDSKIKVQASIHEDKVRISGKSRDDLQAVMKLVRDKDFGIAINFDNRRTI